jgi:hypothetical protein
MGVGFVSFTFAAFATSAPFLTGDRRATVAPDVAVDVDRSSDRITTVRTKVGHDRHEQV